jgi:hypothetical protein
VNSVVLLASHDTAGDIDAANLIVSKEFYQNQWYDLDIPGTVRQRVEEWIDYWKVSLN